jgi:hypothetical protein
MRSDPADEVHAGREYPALALEGLRQPAGNGALPEHQRAPATPRQRRSGTEAADARSDDHRVPHEGSCPAPQDSGAPACRR